MSLRAWSIVWLVSLPVMYFNYDLVFCTLFGLAGSIAAANGVKRGGLGCTLPCLFFLVGSQSFRIWGTPVAMVLRPLCVVTALMIVAGGVPLAVLVLNMACYSEVIALMYWHGSLPAPVAAWGALGGNLVLALVGVITGWLRSRGAMSPQRVQGFNDLSLGCLTIAFFVVIVWAMQSPK